MNYFLKRYVVNRCASGLDSPIALPERTPAASSFGTRGKRVQRRVPGSLFAAKRCLATHGNIAERIMFRWSDADVVPVPVSRSPGLLVRLRRSSVVPSARSRGGELRDCDHADGAPAASSQTGKNAPERSAARVARQRHCVDRAAEPNGRPGTMACPARPGGGHMPADSEVTPARCGVR